MLHRTAKSRPVALKYRPSCIGLPPRQAKACPTRSAVCRPRSPFVSSFPYSLTVCLSTGQSLSYAVCRPPSAVSIRFFVPPFVDGLPHRQAGKPAPPRSAVRRPRSPFVYLFPHSLTVCLPDRLESLLPRGLPSAVCGLLPPSAVSPR